MLIENAEWFFENRKNIHSYPFPIIFGCLNKEHKFPKLQMFSTAEKQVFYSSNNINLFLNNQDFHNIMAETPRSTLVDTVTLGDLMFILSGQETSFSSTVDAKLEFEVNFEFGTAWRFLLEPSTKMNRCTKCQTSTGLPCRIFLRPMDSNEKKLIQDIPLWDRLSNQISGVEDTVLAVNECLILQYLLSLTETDYEKKFMLNYFIFAINCIKGNSDQRRKKHKNTVMQELKGDIAWDDAKNLFAVESMMKLDIPALIPQVYLNIVSSQTHEGINKKAIFYKDNISRVDFIMLRKNNKHIVEIDGLTHFADEEAYTRNIKVERNLKKLGWEVHRFSNLEIKTEDKIDYIIDELGLKDWVDIY